jgi:exodeoxyribonuclease VII large subunit
MAVRRKLSVLVAEIQETIEAQFEGSYFWVIAEITDVKKYETKNWCFLKFIEKKGSTIDTEIKGVFWNTSFHCINNFEQLTGQQFTDGLEITCLVRVRYHKRYGLSLEVMDIDANYTIGKLELDRQATLKKLLSTFSNEISVEDGVYFTPNNSLSLPIYIKRIALITAPNSDGQRDFLQELNNNSYGYKYEVDEFLVTVQGDAAATSIVEALKKIESKKQPYDLVAIVRGGGSQTDFKPFDDFALASKVALFNTPILCGIGHDRNTSIIDLMSRSLKTPTKVAAAIIEINLNYEMRLLQIQQRLQNAASLFINKKQQVLALKQQQLQIATKQFFTYKQQQLQQTQRILKAISPEQVLKRGYALIEKNNAIVSQASSLALKDTIQIILHQHTITSTVEKITTNENS